MTKMIERLSPFLQKTKFIPEESSLTLEILKKVPCLSCKKQTTLEKQISCEACELATYCSPQCRTKDKRFHTKKCIPKDKVEVISNSSNLVIEVVRKRDAKADDKQDIFL